MSHPNDYLSFSSSRSPTAFRAEVSNHAVLRRRYFIPQCTTAHECHLFACNDLSALRASLRGPGFPGQVSRPQEGQEQLAWRPRDSFDAHGVNGRRQAVTHSTNTQIRDCLLNRTHSVCYACLLTVPPATQVLEYLTYVQGHHIFLAAPSVLPNGTDQRSHKTTGWKDGGNGEWYQYDCSWKKLR
jgi:hypothetical protein